MTAPRRTRCRAEPRRKGQRWGNACFARYMRERYRPRIAALVKFARSKLPGART